MVQLCKAQPDLSGNPFLWLEKLGKKIGSPSTSLRINYRRISCHKKLKHQKKLML